MLLKILTVMVHAAGETIYKNKILILFLVTTVFVYAWCSYTASHVQMV